MRPAKAFKYGDAQAIELPEEFRVDVDKVYLKKTSGGFLVITRDPWKLFYEGVERLPDDFMAEGRKQPPAQNRNWNL